MVRRIRPRGSIDGRSSIWHVRSFLHMKAVIPGGLHIIYSRNHDHETQQFHVVDNSHFQ